MGGTQRIASFAEHLPKYGWQPHILTVKDIVYHAYDETPLTRLASVSITRTESLDPNRLLARFLGPTASKGNVQSGRLHFIKKIALRCINFFIVPDNKVLWTLKASKPAKLLLESKQFDCILSSGPPHSSHLFAMKLARKYRLPWVADFRDGWASGDFQPNSTWLHRKIDAYLQQKVIQSASHVITVSSGLEEAIKKFENKKVTTITNGYDATLFQTPYEDTALFQILHVGSVGNFVQVDNFLQSAQLFKKEKGNNAFRIRFIGADLTGKLAEKISAAGLSAVVEHAGYLSHAAVTAALQKADLLVYIVSGNPSTGFIPGKTFEYLASGRPILAIAQKIEGVQLLLQGRVTQQVNPEDVESIHKALRSFYDAYHKKQPMKLDLNFIQGFERKKLVEKLAAVLDAVVR